MIGNLEIQITSLIVQSQINALTSMGLLGNTKTEESTFFYCGNPSGLEAKLETAQFEAIPVIEARVIICGNQVKQPNLGLLIITIVISTLSLIPFFVMFCNWWRKRVSAGYSIPFNTYRQLEKLVLCPSLRALTLTISDNTFGRAKARLIYNMLLSSYLKAVTIINIAPSYDFHNDEWSAFKQNMQPIKNLKITSDIRWFYKVVQ